MHTRFFIMIWIHLFKDQSFKILFFCFSMSRGRSNVYFPCGGPGAEPPHMQRGPCFPLADDKLGNMPPGGKSYEEDRILCASAVLIKLIKINLVNQR